MVEKWRSRGVIGLFEGRFPEERGGLFVDLGRGEN